MGDGASTSFCTVGYYKSLPQRGRGTTKWWLRRARRETLLADTCERKLLLPLLPSIHIAPTTLLIRHSLKFVTPSPLGKAKISLRYEPSAFHLERERAKTSLQRVILSGAKRSRRRVEGAKRADASPSFRRKRRDLL